MLSAAVVVLLLSLGPTSTSAISTLALPPSLPAGGWALSYSGSLTIRQELKVTAMSSGPLRLYTLGTGAPEVFHWMESSLPAAVVQGCMNISAPESSRCLLDFVSGHPSLVLLNVTLSPGGNPVAMVVQTPLARNATTSLYVVNPSSSTISATLNAIELTLAESPQVALNVGGALAIVGGGSIGLGWWWRHKGHSGPVRSQK